MTKAIISQTDESVQEYVQELLCSHFDSDLDHATQLRVLSELERQAGALKEAHMKLYAQQTAEPQAEWGEGTDLS